MDRYFLESKKRAAETELVAANVLVLLGVSSGELSYNQACRVYGGWFSDAVAQGRILPCRYGRGTGRNRWYKVTDILALKAVEYEQLSNIER